MDGGTIYKTRRHIGKGRFERKILSLRHKCDKTSSEQLRLLESGELKRSKDFKLVCGVLRVSKSKKMAQKSG